MNVMFHRDMKLPISDGVTNTFLNIEKNVMYKIKKYKQDNDTHLFFFDISKTWKGEYIGNDFEIFYQPDAEDQQKPSLGLEKEVQQPNVQEKKNDKKSKLEKYTRMV